MRQHILEEHGRLFAAVVALLALTVAGIAAQSGRPTTAWFGVAPPAVATDPHRPVVDVAKVEAPPLRLPAGETHDPELAGPRIRKDVEAIVAFAKQSRAAGDKVWGRVTGFPAAAQTIEWTAQQFKNAGLMDVAVQKYIRKRADVVVALVGGQASWKRVVWHRYPGRRSVVSSSDERIAHRRRDASRLH